MLRIRPPLFSRRDIRSLKSAEAEVAEMRARRGGTNIPPCGIGANRNADWYCVEHFPVQARQLTS